MWENKIYSFIGLARKAGAIVTGEGLTEQAVKREKALLVLVTHDASINTRKKIEAALYDKNIPLLEFGHKEKLGHMLGKTFFSVIAVTDRSFAKRIIELIEQEHNNDNTAHGGGFFEQTKNS